MNNLEHEIKAIEANQKALRESITRSKQLAEDTGALIERHKKSLQNNEPSSASGSPWD